MPLIFRYLAGLVLFGALSCGGGRRVGVLYDTQGEAAPFHPVRLIVVDDRGEEQSIIDQTVTDSKGEFNFKFSGLANASVVITAEINSIQLKGFWAGAFTSIPLHPLTQGLSELIFDITQTTGGRNLLDFDPVELRALTNAALDLDTSDVDLTDQAEVKALIRRSKIARQIALAAGGSITTEASDSFASESVGDRAFEINFDLCPSGAPVIHLSGGAFDFAIKENATLCSVTHPDASPILLENALEIKFPGETMWLYGGEIFPSLSSGSAKVENDREVVSAEISFRKPQVDDVTPPAEDAVSYQVKMYVPEDKNYVRYLLSLHNSGDSDRNLNLNLRSFLVSGDVSALLVGDRTNGELTTDDRFAVAYDPFENRATVGLLFQDGTQAKPSTFYFPGKAGGQVNEMAVAWNEIKLPAQSQQVYLFYVWLSTTRVAEVAREEMLSLARQADMTQMSLAELQALQNFSPTRGTVVGEAGTVIGLAEVTATHPKTLQSHTVIALEDGSFAIPIQVSSGDEVAVTSSDGLETNVQIP